MSSGIFSKELEEKQKGKEESATPETTSSKVDGKYEVEDVDVIQLKNICKTFENGFKLFDNFNLELKDFKDKNQRISFVGPSGSGKSCVLRLISQLDTPDSGEVLVYGKPAAEMPHIQMVFQQYSAFPWQKVWEVASMSLKLKGIGKEERKKRAYEILKLVGLEGQEEKWAQYPILSGGQLQRVCLSRALCDAKNSKIILLDEVTSALDVKSKRDIEDAILNVCYNSDLDPTIINVTHDISEAVYLSNRIYVFASNPCRVHKIIDVSFGVERRTHELRDTREFAEYVSQVESALNEIM